jgi:hypothetical protein
LCDLEQKKTGSTARGDHTVAGHPVRRGDPHQCMGISTIVKSKAKNFAITPLLAFYNAKTLLLQGFCGLFVAAE